MKSVLMSIKPKYCELIASGKKTIEVRKTKPKLETPFKVYIYMTMGKCPKFVYNENLEKQSIYERDPNTANGKVIGEFVCDRIITAPVGSYCRIPVSASQVDVFDLLEYADGKTIYGWHISDLVIYDKPRGLSEFYAEGDCDCMNCKKCAWFDRGNGYNVEDDCALAYKGADLHKSLKPIIRPPQSWCYVESEGTK